MECGSGARWTRSKASNGRSRPSASSTASTEATGTSSPAWSGTRARSGPSSVVVTFDPHPMAVVAPDRRPPALATLDHRLQLLADEHVDAVLVLPFTATRAQQSAEDFVREVLVDALHAKAVHVGENFRFGHRAAGDVALLRELGTSYGFEVVPVPLGGRRDDLVVDLRP